MMKKLSVILIFIGILIITIPPIGIYYTACNQRKMINEWMAGTSDHLEKYDKLLQETFEGEKIEQTEKENIKKMRTPSLSSVKIKESLKPGKSHMKQKILGMIIIDKIKVKLPVVEGSGNNSLRYGAGHIPGTSGIGQPGNCALAGHRNYTFGRYFNRLDELKKGDRITVTTKKAAYTYQVYQKQVVTPDDGSVLKGNENEHVLTLITCTPIYIASHRLVVQARLIDQPPEKDSKK